MWVLLLEALGAGLLLVGIVWWTMFSGRRGGERVHDADAATPQPEDPPDQPPR